MSDTQNPIARDELIKVIREIDLAYDENTSPRDYRERMADAMLAFFGRTEGTR